MPVQVQDGEILFDPGQLRHRITFLDSVTVEDESGNSIEWQPSPETTSAEIMPIRGANVLKAGQDITQVLLTVTIRYRASVTPQRRFRTRDGVEFLIQAVQNVLFRNEWMELTCLRLGS